MHNSCGICDRGRTIPGIVDTLKCGSEHAQHMNKEHSGAERYHRSGLYYADSSSWNNQDSSDFVRHVEELKDV